MEIILQLLLMVAGFVLLIKGADWFVEGAAGVALKFNVPQLIIGLTIVAMGTSAPEAAISITSALKGSAGIAVGNVLGSNIMNVLLILGITAMIAPLAVQRQTIKYEIPFVIAITIICGLLGLKDNEIELIDGIILWILFLIYLGYLFIMAKHDPNDEDDVPEEGKKPLPMVKLIFFIIFGAACIVFGSDLTVDSATNIAHMFGISDRVIGLTIVALGTSLPELVTCITAATKNKSDIAIGNIVGSNIFNILFVLGTSALITPIEYSQDFLVDTILCVLTAILLLGCVFNKKKILRRRGALIMLAGYVAYYTFIILI